MINIHVHVQHETVHVPATDVRREYLILSPFKSDDQYKSIRSESPDNAAQSKTNMKMISQCGIYLFLHLCHQELNHISRKVI